MCMSCGCNEYLEKHSAVSIDWDDLCAAADEAGIEPVQAAENVMMGAMRMKARGGAQKAVACEVFKAADEHRYTLGVAYPATRPDVGVALDGHIDYVSAEALERAAWNFMRNGGGIGLDHAKSTTGRGKVVESYIYRGPDWEQSNGYVVKAGDWLLGVIWDTESWNDIKAGRRRGLSPQGAAKRRIPTPEALARLREPTKHL